MNPSLLSLTSPSALPTTFLNPTKSPFPIQTEFPKTSFRSFPLNVQCSALSVAIDASPGITNSPSKPSAAEVSRTIMELSSTGTLSAISLQDGWPLGIGTRFVVDAHGTPALCLNEPGRFFAAAGPSSFNVQLKQSRSRTRQCTLLGNLEKLEDGLLLKKLCKRWEKKFGEDADGDNLYVIKVDRILQLEDFKEDTVWITSIDYFNAEPDPLRNCAEKIVNELDAKHAEDILRVCHVYVDSQFQVTDAKLIWVDRLGFDLHIYSEEGNFTCRVPFPREVSDEKSLKSSLNSMFHLAWEVEKGYAVQEFERIKLLKRISR
ncbi:glutamyl-tRNA reductase-binding protein, chloroplastic [Phalaenopsis equestris]|uniref:glutamyl-tRNA reductase-binding protein, chloroplastic n=1 Tax=Phalaenopsis equestris TaxID=78828 RepID=UPI0009E41C38|nr:glutamyl-tRNA reductase-binding protein, chloroplastic [Phalaenopsis equestris]